MVEVPASAVSKVCSSSDILLCVWYVRESMGIIGYSTRTNKKTEKKVEMGKKNQEMRDPIAKIW